MARRRRLEADEERALAVAMREAEQRAREVVSSVPDVAEALEGPKQRTVAADIDRLGLAVDLLWRVSGMRPELRPKALQARQAWEQASEHRWALAMSGERIAVGEARKINGGILSHEELCQEGRIGLLRAAKRFDPERGLRFSTYARWWVRAQLTRQIDYTGRSMRLPNSASEQRRRLQQLIRERERHGEGWTVSELAQDLRVDEDRIRILLGTFDEWQSLDDQLPGEGETGRRVDLVPDEGPAVDEEISVAMRERWARWLLQQLPERHRQVLVSLYGLEDGQERTLADVGRRFGVSKERIRQLREQALEALRGFRERNVKAGESAAVPEGTPVAAILDAIRDGNHTGKAIAEAVHGSAPSAVVKATRLQLRALEAAGMIERHGRASATRYTMPGEQPPPVNLRRNKR